MGLATGITPSEITSQQLSMRNVKWRVNGGLESRLQPAPGAVRRSYDRSLFGLRRSRRSLPASLRIGIGATLRNIYFSSRVIPSFDTSRFGHQDRRLVFEQTLAT